MQFFRTCLRNVFWCWREQIYEQKFHAYFAHLQPKFQMETPGSITSQQSKGIKMKRKPMFDDSHTTLLNGIKLAFEKGFGFSQDAELKNNAYCLDDNRIVYLISSQITLYDMLAESQKLIHTFDVDDQVGAIAYFKNVLEQDNVVFAVRNLGKSFPIVTVLNFSKNYSQNFVMDNLYKEQKITDLVLFNDYRNIAIISRLDSAVRLTILEIAVNKEICLFEYLPFNPIQIFTLPQYPTKLAMYTATDIIITDIQQQLKILTIPLHRHFELTSQQKILQIATSSHSELILYIITNQANLYFLTINPVQNKVTKLSQYFLGNYTTLDERGVEIVKKRIPSCICANQYNLLIGYYYIEEMTLVKLSSVANQPPLFQPIKFSCPFLHCIVRMSFAIETMAVCITVQVKENDRHQFSIPIQSEFLKEKGQDKTVKQCLKNHALPPGKIFPVVFNLLLYDTLVETLKSPVQAIVNPMLLTKKILDICVLPTKKLILVLSADKKIKAIKYEEVSSIRFDKMLAWQMVFNVNDRPTTLDVHPLTFVVAVGSKFGVKLFNIYPDGMKSTNFQFNLTNCESVRYSKFGHYLIAGSTDLIMLINPYQNIIQKRIQLNHTYGGIKQLYFIDRDMHIFANYMNGSSQVLKTDGSKSFEIWNKNSKCIHSCYDPVFDVMIMSYEDHEVKFYRERGEIQFAILWTYPFVVTKILLVNELGTAFMGTSTGKVRAYQWPFTDMVKFNKSYTQIQLHKCAITQVSITHDFSFLITGAEDGTIFFSKIIPYSDGIAVSDSSILHTFKVNKRNFTSLYYLQNFMCTNSSNQSQREQQIMRYESDKSDFASQFVYILQNLQQASQTEFEKFQQSNLEALRKIIDPLEKEVEEINHQKKDAIEDIISFSNKWQKDVQVMEDQRVQTMRNLYKESDHLKVKLDFYTKQFQEQIQEAKKKYAIELRKYEEEKKCEQAKLIQECDQLEKEFMESLVSNKQALKEEDEEDKIYKSKMIEKLDLELQTQKEEGERLRKSYNKYRHTIRQEEDKLKYLQQIASEIEGDIGNAKARRENLVKQIDQLHRLLKQKDKEILNEEKAVKELLKKSINNYSHEQFLKHKQDELIDKQKYLQKQKSDLDEKYKSFQQYFINMTKETMDFTAKIEQAYQRIMGLKETEKIARQKIFIKKYKDKKLYNLILQTFHECISKTNFSNKIKEILAQENSAESNQSQEEKMEAYVDRREHLIDQVVNANKLRKIDDKIKKNLMYKLNRETVTLTSQVNQLRKEKKTLTVKIRGIHACIREIEGYDQQNSKYQLPSLTDIVPINISVIRSHQNSKHSKPLPFQLYHQNKILQHSSTYSKLNSKSILEEGSTQLPSILKHSQSHAGSIVNGEQSSLFGVQENDDEVAQ